MKEKPEQKRFSLLYKGRKCRIYETLIGSKQVKIQFEDETIAVVERSDVQSPDDNYPFRGPDV